MLDFENWVSKRSGFDLRKILVKPGQTVSLDRDFDPSYTGDFREKAEATGRPQMVHASLRFSDHRCDPASVGPQISQGNYRTSGRARES
jgi:hypothetical protein